MDEFNARTIAMEIIKVEGFVFALACLSKKQDNLQEATQLLEDRITKEILEAAKGKNP